MNLASYAPQAIVTFSTEKGELVARATNDPNAQLDNDVLEINTIRDMGADAPTFSIVLSRRKAWHQWITANDLVTIVMHRPPEEQAVVFVGLVDDSRKTVSLDPNNGVSRTITISGRGVNKAFIAFDIGVVPETGGKMGVTAKSGWLQASGINIIGMTPKGILSALWENIAKKYVNYEWSSGKKLFDYIGYNITDRTGMVMVDSASVINFQGSLWAFIREISENPWYEVFWEMYNNVPTMVCRPTPFSKDNWFTLPRTKITDVDVVVDETGRSDTETYTLYSVGAKTFVTGGTDPFKTFGNLPIWYEPYFKKYGIRRLHAKTMYAATAAGMDVATNAPILRKLQADLYNWNVKNNSMFNGTIIVKGSNRFKIGTILEYASMEDNIGLEYYIKSVTHKFTNFGNWITQLEVIRGSKPEQRFTKPYDNWTEAKDIGWQPYSTSRQTNNAAGVRSQIKPMEGPWVSKGQQVANYAIEMLNKDEVRYCLGGRPETSWPVLDCASWTEYVYAQVTGMSIGRNCPQQAEGSTATKFNDPNCASPGDLVMFKIDKNDDDPTHVGLIIDRQGTFIHNSTSKNGLVEANFITNAYWKENYYYCVRLLQDAGAAGKDIRMIATAYGASVKNGGCGTGITYCGSTVAANRTIAADLNVLPLYTKVSIECPSRPGVNGVYIVEDKGGDINGDRIDIYFDDINVDPDIARAKMMEFGKPEVFVTVIGQEKPPGATRT